MFYDALLDLQDELKEAKQQIRIYVIYIDIVQSVFNEKIYPELKEYIETNSLYNPLVTQSKPAVSKRFPIIPVKLLTYNNKYNNLSYGEETYRFGIEINVNCQNEQINDKQVLRRTICEELTELSIQYFKTNYRVRIRINPNAINTDERVHRAIIRITGIIDIKYGLNKLVIYPRQ